MKIKSIGKVPISEKEKYETQEISENIESPVIPKQKAEPLREEIQKESVKPVRREIHKEQLSPPDSEKPKHTITEKTGEEYSKSSKTLYYILGGVVFIALVFISYYFFFYRNTGETETDTNIPKNTPMDIKMKELEQKEKELEAKQKELEQMKTAADTIKKEVTKPETEVTGNKDESKVPVNPQKKTKQKKESIETPANTNQNKGRTTFK